MGHNSLLFWTSGKGCSNPTDTAWHTKAFDYPVMGKAKVASFRCEANMQSTTLSTRPLSRSHIHVPYISHILLIVIPPIIETIIYL